MKGDGRQGDVMGSALAGMAGPTSITVPYDPLLDPDLTTVYHVRVTIDDDSVRVFKVHATSLEAAEEMAQERMKEILYVAASTPDPGEEDFAYDDELGDKRLMLVRADVGWFDGDEEHDAGFTCYGLMTDGSRVFPMGHPQTFAHEQGAWAIAHRLRFDPENGACWVAGANETT